MGNHISELESVNLKDLPADVYETLVSEKYTVQRNPKNPDGPLPGTRGAREDEGWIIPREASNESSWKAAHATFIQNSKDTKVWKFNMNNGREINDPEFTYGWRTIGSFWPTRLTTWTEREAWSAQLLTLVMTLQTPMEKQEETLAKRPMTEEQKARVAAAEEQTRNAFRGYANT